MRNLASSSRIINSPILARASGSSRSSGSAPLFSPRAGLEEFQETQYLSIDWPVHEKSVYTRLVG